MKRFYIEPDFKAHKTFVITASILSLLSILIVSLAIPAFYLTNGRIHFDLTYPTFVYMQCCMNLLGLQFSFGCYFVMERIKLLNEYLR